MDVNQKPYRKTKQMGSADLQVLRLEQVQFLFFFFSCLHFYLNK